jgi:hypothetical protein
MIRYYHVILLIFVVIFMAVNKFMCIGSFMDSVNINEDKWLMLLIMISRVLG